MEKDDHPPPNMSGVKIMNDYHLLYEETPEELGKSVAEYLAKGWELHGSPFAFVDVIDGEQQQQFAQAIVHQEVQF